MESRKWSNEDGAVDVRIYDEQTEKFSLKSVVTLPAPTKTPQEVAEQLDGYVENRLVDEAIDYGFIDVGRSSQLTRERWVAILANLVAEELNLFVENPDNATDFAIPELLFTLCEEALDRAPGSPVRAGVGK